MDVKELIDVLKELGIVNVNHRNCEAEQPHPMLGKRVIVRTYSAGVHIGTLDWVNPDNAKECKLSEALRLWKWEGGGLSLSAIANHGIKGGRLNRTGEIYLTEAIEYIPIRPSAEATLGKFVEDEDE